MRARSLACLIWLCAVPLACSDSTGDGDGLYVHLSPGTLEPSATGELGLNSPETFVVAPLKSQMGTQYYDLTAQWPSLPRIGSVTIYRYNSEVQEAYGTANLTER